MKLTDYKVLSFDCYGTLIDWESGILENLWPLIQKLDYTPVPDKVLETHAKFEARTQSLHPSLKYPQLLSRVYEQMAAEWDISIDPDESRNYGNSVGTWPAFDDSVSALKTLKKHFQLVILSNVDNTSFNKSNNRLEVEFDDIITAEDVGSYKPNPNNFRFMLGKLAQRGIEKHEILHVAESLFHDHIPANHFELDNCWIYRRYQKEGYGATKTPEKMPTFNFRYNSMKELADAVVNENITVE